MPTVPPTYDVMVRKTTKYYGQVQTDDPLKIPQLAKDMVKNADQRMVEYDVAFAVKSEPFDPDGIP